MRILLVNKFFYPKGGAETYYFALRNLLLSKGHTIIDFAMADSKNLPSDYETYFVSNVDYNDVESLSEQVKIAARTIYSVEAKEKFRSLVQDTKPDLVHLNNFHHQISPSILDITKNSHIPTVYTAHDLKLVCPSYLMYNNRGICEKCKPNKYYHCTLNKCIKQSIAKSSIATIEAYYYHSRKSYQAIDRIITPSSFHRNKMIDWGTPTDQIVHLPNFLDQDFEPGAEVPIDEYYIYTGRLSREKGLFTLVEAFIELGLKLIIVGDGPERVSLTELLMRRGITNISLVGFKSGDKLRDLVQNSRAVIIPSECYENGPYSAIEALQLARPLIGSNIGGIPELIDGNGFLFDPGVVRSLVSAVRRMEETTEVDYQQMSLSSKRLFRENHTSDQHYKALSQIYGEII